MAPTTDRKAQVITAATSFFDGLARKDVASVPWADAVVFRAPLVSGGAGVPLIGRDAVLAFFSTLGPNLGPRKKTASIPGRPVSVRTLSV